MTTKFGAFVVCALVLGISAQQDILDIVENIDLIELATVLNQVNIKEICETIRFSERDDVCFRQLQIVCDNKTFLEKMVDASSKFPYSGMLVKTRLDLGSYDECVQLDTTEDNVRVLGKHCTSGLIIPVTNDSTAFEQAFKLSTCIPHQCSALDLLELVNSTDLYPLFNDIACSTKESHLHLGWDDYAVISFLALVLLLMVAATIYDMYFYYNNIDCPNILFRAFSVLYNGQKLLKTSKASGEEIKVIHGLRVVSMMWIVAGHAFSTMMFFPGTDVDFTSNFEISRKTFYITTAPLAVDTFFFISGFLLAYHYLKTKPTSFGNHLKRIPAMILHRYIRLTPVVASAFFILITVFMHMGDGPMYQTGLEPEKDRCLKNWWAYFLYVQNYVDYNNMCLSHTWYLSADWQLFLLSPIVLVPVAMLVKSNFKWVMGQLLVLNLIFTCLPVGLKFLLKDYDNPFETHARLNDYFIGFTLGVYMRERAKNGIVYRFSTVSNIIVWTCVLTTMVLTIMTFKEVQVLVHRTNDNSYSTYSIILTSVWSVGLAWIVYACHSGCGGVINWFLTTPLMQVLSKLTFCMYITHAGPVLYLRLITRTPIDFSQIGGIKDSIVAYMSTLVLSVGWTLAFESPLITIEKYFLRKQK